MLRSVRRRLWRCVGGCGRLVGRRRRSVRIGSGSGKRSVGVCRVRTRLPRLGCPLRWERDGSAKLVGCRPCLWGRCRAVICRLLSGKRSPFSMLRVLGCGRSAAGLTVHLRRSRGSCAATRRLVIGMWSIGQRLLSGTRTGVPAARRSPSWLPTTSFATTCRIALVG